MALVLLYTIAGRIARGNFRRMAISWKLAGMVMIANTVERWYNTYRRLELRPAKQEGGEYVGRVY